MRKLFRAVALTAVLTLVLASCDILFQGTFPADVAQTTARIDLSSSISAADAASFHLSVVKSGKYEFVILVSDTGFTSSLPHLLVLSPSLVVQDSYTMDQLIACNPVGNSFNGTGTIAHLYDGTIVIGNLQTNVTSSGLTLSQKLTTSSVNLSGWSIEGPSPSYYTWGNFYINSGQTLFYSEWASDWSGYTTKNAVVSSGSTSYGLEGVFTDPEDATNDTALLVFSESSSNNAPLHFLTVVKDSEFFNQFPGAPIMENTAFTGSQVVKNDLERGEVYVTTDGIVGYNGSSRSLVFFTLADPSNEKPLHVGDTPNGLQRAFSFSGTYYCTWDPSTRILTRYEKWW
jgi:hypothetical protein